EADAFTAQVNALGLGTTLLVDTYDIAAGIRTAIEVAGPGLGAVRIDSGDLAVLAVQSRQQLDSLGATGTRIVLSGDLDEYALAALAAAPVDAYGVGTSVVTGSGAPSAGLVYKLVEVEGRAVAKRSEQKASPGGRKTAVRRHRTTGTATEKVVARQPPAELPGDRLLQVPMVRGGQAVELPSLLESRHHLRHAMGTIPWDGLKLSRGEPAVPTTFD
ncbi:MAG: nicotinate phosphoribosyltransferase, partial [Pseudonocardiaceae bacterium]